MRTVKFIIWSSFASFFHANLLHYINLLPFRVHYTSKGEFDDLLGASRIFFVILHTGADLDQKQEQRSVHARFWEFDMKNHSW